MLELEGPQELLCSVTPEFHLVLPWTLGQVAGEEHIAEGLRGGLETLSFHIHDV